MTTRIGIIAIQGDVEEHVRAMEEALAERGEKGEVVKIKHRGIVKSCDAIIIPGGKHNNRQANGARRHPSGDKRSC
jgi:glutamine amidotransferase PdxT